MIKKILKNSGQFKKGQVPWNKNKTGIYSEKALKKMREARLGKPQYAIRGKNNPIHRPEVKAKMIKSLTGRKLSEKHKKAIRDGSQIRGDKNPMRKLENRKKVSKATRGEKHYNWKGGRKKLQEIIRRCFKYRQWRSDIFTRDNFTCQRCGIRNRVGLGKTIYLEAHHYPKRFAEILREYKITTLEQALACEELWNINGGITFCKECHNLTKGRYANCQPKINNSI